MSASVRMTLSETTTSDQYSAMLEKVSDGVLSMPGIRLEPVRRVVSPGARGIDAGSVGGFVITLLGTSAVTSLIGFLKAYVRPETEIVFESDGMKLSVKGRDLTPDRLDRYARALSGLTAQE